MLGAVAIACVAVLVWDCRDEWPVGRRTGCERNPAGSLKTIGTSEEDFRDNDRDGNGVKDYWTRDVYSLFALCPPTGGVAPENMIKLTEPSLAASDAAYWSNPTPVAADVVPTGESVGTISPKASYWVVAMERDEYDLPYDSGNGRNLRKFGFCTYPTSVQSGRTTYIVNETGVVWRRETGATPVLQFPREPEAEGWRVVK